MLELIGNNLLKNKKEDLNSLWIKPKRNTCKILLNFTQITVYKVFYKDSNAENVENRHSKDAQNVNRFGIAQDNVKLEIGLNIRLNVTQEQSK